MSLPNRIQKNKPFHSKLKKEVSAVNNHLFTPIFELKGFNPIKSLLRDEEVSEVMVNGPKEVFCERKGKLFLTPVKFCDNEHIKRVIQEIVSPLGYKIDGGSPLMDVRLPDGSRVNAMIPHSADISPTLTIRKYPKNSLQLNDLIQFETFTAEIASFLDACVKAGLNIVISGGPGSGKTTTLNALSNFIPEDERIVKGIAKNILKMGPNRVIIDGLGCRETLEVLEELDADQVCILTTIHANSPKDTIGRLETMSLLSTVGMSLKSIRERIVGTVNIIIQQARLRDGTRKIVSISEVIGLEGDEIVLQELYTFKQTGVCQESGKKGQLVSTGVHPKCFDRIKKAGFEISAPKFYQN